MHIPAVSSPTRKCSWRLPAGSAPLVVLLALGGACLTGCGGGDRTVSVPIVRSVVSDYAGTYTGVWSAGGTVELDAGASGDVTATFTGTGSNAGNTGVFNGTLNDDGVISFVGGGGGGTGAGFTITSGKITIASSGVATVTGTWASAINPANNGTWSAARP